MADAVQQRQGGLSSGSAVRALWLAVAMSIAIDSVLIIVGFAVASRYVEGMLSDTGFWYVVGMIESFVVTFPLVSFFLILVFKKRHTVYSVNSLVFVTFFSTGVVISFIVLQILVMRILFGAENSLVSLITWQPLLINNGLAFLVAVTFAIIYHALLRRGRP